MIERYRSLVEKATESLDGAESEFVNGRYNNCANRAYYAYFQSTIVALQREGINPRGAGGEWSHAFVPAQFDGVLINRRHRYPAELRGILSRTYVLRQTADYDEDDSVSRTQAERALRRTRTYVDAILGPGGKV
jgi:uncharacterized protein (UPF0332 family)